MARGTCLRLVRRAGIAWAAVACLAIVSPHARAATAPVCSNGQYPGDNGLSPAGQEWQTRTIFYCPQGAKTIQLLFTGGYAAGSPPVELQLTDPQQMHLSVETYVPPVWSPTRRYVVGDEVSAPVSVNNGVGTYVAVAPSMTSLPTAYNTARWQPVTPKPIPITCNQSRTCLLGTHVDASGKTVTNAFLLTDPLPVSIAPGSLIAIRSWIHQSGSQVMADGPVQPMSAGSYATHGTTEPDLTLSGAGRPSTGPIHKKGLLAILGTQNVAKPVPTACVVGDSRVSGVSGRGIGSVAIASGGAGYNSGDIGRLVTNIDSGGSPDNPISSAVYVIQNVDTSTGKVSQVGVYDAGHYAVPVSGTTQGVASANPSGTQATRGTYNTWGQGLKVTIGPTTMQGSDGYFVDTATFADGFLQAGMSEAGIPVVAFSRSNDRIATWASPGGDTSRLAAIRETGCSSVLISLGINDDGAGRSAAQIEADFTTVARQLLALGTVRAVYVLTIFPSAKSNDYWVTARNQYPLGNEAARTEFNDWARAVPPPFAGVIDTASVVEVDRTNALTRNGGLWLTDGTPHFPTPDFIHLAPGTAALAAKLVAANTGLLQ